MTYGDLERANAVVLLGLEPEEEAGSLFLRLRKVHRANTKVRIHAVAPFTTRGLGKLGATVSRAAPGAEVDAIEALAHDGELALDGGGVILVGERLGEVPGALRAAAVLADQTGARLAWVPRRAGDRGALDAGCLGTVLPGGRPLGDAAARVDVSTVWGSEVPLAAGRDTDGDPRGRHDRRARRARRRRCRARRPRRPGRGPRRGAGRRLRGQPRAARAAR